MKPLWLFIAFAFSIPYAIEAQTIKWFFDTDDSSFGNSAAGDIDNDGKLEIVFGCYRNDSSVYALNAEDGSLLWKRNLSGAAEGCNDVAPLIYDVDKDGLLDVVVPSSCNPKTFCFNGSDGSTKWETPLHGSDSPPTVSDMDHDGKPEILHGNFGGYVSCLNGEDGSIAWDLLVDGNSWIQTAPTILDADNDGNQDFVVGNWSFGTDHRIFCYRADNQQLLWDTDLPDDYMYHGASVADLDNDNLKELVIGCYDGRVYVLNAEDGSLAWKFAYSDSFYIASPTSIADLNDDGYYEIVFFDYNRAGVLSHDGNLIWSFTLPNAGQSFRGAAISDVNGDQMLDIVFGSSNGHVYALSGDSGQVIIDVDLAAHYGSPDFEIDHGPIIADFDKDGTIDIFIVGGHTEFPNFQNNYGRGYMISTGSTGGPDWLMFRKDSVRSGLLPIEKPSNVQEVSRVKNLKLSYTSGSGGFIISIENDIVQFVELSVYDIQGRKISTLNNNQLSTGEHQWKLDLNPGIATYIVEAKTPDASSSLKIFAY